MHDIPFHCVYCGSQRSTRSLDFSHWFAKHNTRRHKFTWMLKQFIRRIERRYKETKGYDK